MLHLQKGGEKEGGEKGRGIRGERGEGRGRGRERRERDVKSDSVSGETPDSPNPTKIFFFSLSFRSWSSW